MHSSLALGDEARLCLKKKKNLSKERLNSVITPGENISKEQLVICIKNNADKEIWTDILPENIQMACKNHQYIQHL